MKNSPKRHALEMMAFRWFCRWLYARSHERVGVAGRRLGRFAHRVLGSKRRLALRNLELALPELSPEEHEDIARRCFEHFGAYFFEIFSAARLDEEDLASRCELRGLENLDRALQDDRGVFLTTGHYGCWEVPLVPVARWAAERGRQFHAVARPLDNPKLDAVIRESRERSGIQIIDKRGAAHRMLNAYRRGHLVAIIIDQHVRPSAGIQVPFFGQPAWTSPVLATLSLRTGAPVIPFTCVPADEPGRYRVTFHQAIEPLDLPPGGGTAEAEIEMTRRYLAAVERDIRARPEYWLWMHRRWRA